MFIKDLIQKVLHHPATSRWRGSRHARAADGSDRGRWPGRSIWRRMVMGNKMSGCSRDQQARCLGSCWLIQGWQGASTLPSRSTRTQEALESLAATQMVRSPFNRSSSPAQGWHRHGSHLHSAVHRLVLHQAGHPYLPSLLWVNMLYYTLINMLYVSLYSIWYSTLHSIDVC